MYEQEIPRTIKEPKLKLALELLDVDILSAEQAEQLVVDLLDEELTDDFTISEFSQVFVEARRGKNMLRNVSMLLDGLAANPEAMSYIIKYLDGLKS